MNTPNLSQNETTSLKSAAKRRRYQAIQVAGLVSPFVAAIGRAHDLDAVWVVDFPYAEMVHPTRPTLTLSTVLHRARQAAVNEHMRVDSLESALRVLTRASQYSEWTEKSYAPLLELLRVAIAAQCASAGTAKLAH